jgi:acetoin utilization deacetylase AcuC-like enzyme
VPPEAPRPPEEPRQSEKPLPTALLLHPDCGLHDTGWAHPEHQGRLPAIVHALERQTPAFLELVLQQEGRHATHAQLRRVHTDTLIERVQAAAELAARTGSVVSIESDTVASAASWDAACAAAGCAIDAVDIVLTGRADTALALSRPPGHHATADTAMGFCLFNNVAVAAREAQARHDVERVLIIDWDVHHGNGTQDIFYDDPRVYYLSLHIDGHYPGTGSADERGVAAGHGTTLNVPLPAGTPAPAYRTAFERAVEQAFADARPELVIVSAGFDCLAGDPLGGLLLEPEDLHAMTTSVLAHADAAGAHGTVVVLEGGYAPKRVAAGVVATMRALAGLDGPV